MAARPSVSFSRTAARASKPSTATSTASACTGNKLELCRVGTNPERVAQAARAKTYTLGKRKLRLYCNVEIVEVQEGAGER